jgi:hypothetical protein
MFTRMRSLVVAAVALLALTSAATAAPRHTRLKHPAIAASKIPADVTKAIKKEFPTGKITGSWMEEKGFEMEVFVSVPNSAPIEVVFQKKASGWSLVGYEFPVATASLTPKAVTAIHSKYPSAKILEVEMFFDASWKSLGYQVTVQNGSSNLELFILPSGVWGTDPW